MITRLHGATSTLVANPRRKRRKAARSNPRKPRSLASKVKSMHARVAKKIPAGAHPVAYLFPGTGTKTTKSGKVKKFRTLTASRSVGVTKPKYTVVGYGKGKDLGIVANPRRRRKHHNPRALMPHYRKHKSSRRRKNPMLEIAGVPVVEMAIGSLGAIAAVAALAGVVESQIKPKLPQSLQNYRVDTLIAPAAVAAVSAFAYTKTSGTAKDVAKYAFIGSVFIAINETIGAFISDKVKDALGPAKAASGIYIDPYGGKPAVGGMYMQTSGMHGMYMTAEGAAGGYAQADMGGLGLYQAKSIYG